MGKDEQHLRYLTIGFYVYAAIMAVVSLLPLIHVYIGYLIITGGFRSGPELPPPPFMGYVFAGMGLTIILLGLTIAVLNFAAARFLSARSKYMFCFVIAAVDCLFAPIGTLLGIFAIIVLLRDSVKDLFIAQSGVPSRA